MVIFQLEPLQHFDDENVTLQLGKPLPNALPWSMGKWNRGIRMCCMLLRTASHPSLGDEFLWIWEMFGLPHGVHDEVTDNISFWYLISLKNHVHLCCSGETN